MNTKKLPCFVFIEINHFSFLFFSLSLFFFAAVASQQIKSVLSDPNFQPFQSVSRKHEARNSFKQKVVNGLKAEESNSENWPSAFGVPKQSSISNITLSAEKKNELQSKASHLAKHRSPHALRHVATSPKGTAKLSIESRTKSDPRGNRDRRTKSTSVNGELNVNKMVTLNSTNSNNETPLTVASTGGNLDLVKFLLSRGADIEHREKKGLTPLMLAAREGHVDVLQHLIEAGAVIEAFSERTKDTALTLASSAGHYDAVSMLLNKGANKEHRNVSDYTSLALAAAGGHREVINLLLSYGAEINSRTGSKLGISPLMLAAMNGHAEVLKLLLDRGGDINAYIETNRNTALTLACFQGRSECVELLLQRGATIEHRAKTGLTPLMEAASGGFADVGRVLIARGADINAPPVPASKDTALTIAADKGHSEFVKILLESGAFIDVKNKKGFSPLWLACHSGHKAVVKILVDAKCDVDSQDNRKVSCIVAACRRGHLEIVQYLLQHVTQLPSDQDIQRSVELCTEDVREKVQTCSNALLVAKARQEQEAAKHAQSLLELIDQERSKEERRKAAAARKKKKKDERKKAKKQENKAGEDKSESSECDKKSTKNESENSSPTTTATLVKSEIDDEDDDETSAITGNDEEFEHYDEILVEDFENVNFNTQDFKTSSSDKKKTKKQTSNKTNAFKSSTKAVENVKEKTVSLPVTLKSASPPTLEWETDMKRSAKKISGRGDHNTKLKTSHSKASKYQKTSPVPPLNVSSSSTAGSSNTSSNVKENGKRDEGWREVSQVSSRRGKRVNVQASAISRVIGRAGCNINTVRELSGAYIEVEKQGLGLADRWVLIRGSPEASKYASQLINSLANSPDTELSEHVYDLGLDAVPILLPTCETAPTQHAIFYIESLFGPKACANLVKNLKKPPPPSSSSSSSNTTNSAPSTSISTAKSQPVSGVSPKNVALSTGRSNSSNDATVRENKQSSSSLSTTPSKRSNVSVVKQEVKTSSPSPTQNLKNETISTEAQSSQNTFTPITSESIENGTSVWCKSPVNVASSSSSSTAHPTAVSPKMMSSVKVEVGGDDSKSGNNLLRASYASPGSFSTTSTSSLASANTLPLNIPTTHLTQNSNYSQLGNVRSAPCTPPISNISTRIGNKFDANPRIMSSPSSSAFEPSLMSKKQFQDLFSMGQDQDKQSMMFGSNRVSDGGFNDSEQNLFRNRQFMSQMPTQNNQLMDFFRNSANSSLQSQPQQQQQPQQSSSNQKIASMFSEMNRPKIPPFNNHSFTFNNGFNNASRADSFNNSNFMMNATSQQAPLQQSNIGNVSSNDFMNNVFQSNTSPMRMMQNNFSMIPSGSQSQTASSVSTRSNDSLNNRFSSYQRSSHETVADRNGSASSMFGPNYASGTGSNFENFQDDIQRGKIVPIGAERAKKQSTYSQAPAYDEAIKNTWDLSFDPFLPSSNANSSNSVNSSNYFGYDQNPNGFDPMFPQYQQNQFNDSLIGAVGQSSRSSAWGNSSIMEPVESLFGESSQMVSFVLYSFIFSFF